MKRMVLMLMCVIWMGSVVDGLAEENGKWYDRIGLSGLIQAEVGHLKTDYKDPAAADTSAGEVDLSTVELGIDAAIHPQLQGHVLLKYEEEDVFLDEGFITLSGPESLPAYLIVGRQYIPFGNFDTHFVTDPNTLVLGETNEGAAVVGYRLGGELLDMALGAYNGKINKTSAGDDDQIDSFVAGIKARPMEGLSLGVAYTSNLASSDGLSEAVADVDPATDELDPVTLERLVGGWSAFVTYEFLERFRLIGEYVAALEGFKSGELYDLTDTQERRPAAWNIELGAALADSLELAVRCGGSDDGAAFLTETQYGAVLNWGLFHHTNLALEYLHGEYEGDEVKTDSFIAQLAVEF